MSIKLKFIQCLPGIKWCVQELIPGLSVFRALIHKRPGHIASHPYAVPQSSLPYLLTSLYSHVKLSSASLTTTHQNEEIRKKNKVLKFF